MNFFRFILNLFEFKTLRKDFYAHTNMANEVTCRLMCCHMATYAYATLRMCDTCH